jgi:hypothetical protein
MINVSKIYRRSDFYDFGLNEDLETVDILMYYVSLFTCASVSLPFFYFVCYKLNTFYNKKNKDDCEEKCGSKSDEVPYEMKWFQEYDEIVESKNQDEDEDGEDGEDGEGRGNSKCDLTEEFVDSLSLKTVTDTTPRGDVLMYYSSKLSSFVYHSRTKEIPYKYLETVARKYVIEYKCTSLYIDIRKEYEKGLNKYKEIKEKEEKAASGDVEVKEKSKKKQVFANLKTYNRKGEVHNKQKDKIYILKEQANRYSYRGKIEEYNKKTIETTLSKTMIETLLSESSGESGESRDNIEKENKLKNIDFASFKKMHMT